MDEQKRLLLAVALSVVVLVGYQFFFVTPPPPENTPAQQPNTQTARDAVSQSQTDIPVENRSPRAIPRQNDGAAAPGSTLVPQKAAKDFRTISVSTPLYRIDLSEYLAAVTSFELADYKENNRPDSSLKQLVSPHLPRGTLFLDTEGGSIRGLADAVFSADTSTSDLEVPAGKKTVTFSWSNDSGITVQKTFTFRADSYLIDCNVLIQNQSDMPLNDDLMVSTPGFYNDEVKKSARFSFIGPAAFLNNAFETIAPKDIDEKDTYTGTIEWAGYTGRYFLTAVLPQNPVDGRLKLTFENDIVTNRFVQKMERLDPGKQQVYEFVYYMGPKSHKILSRYDNKLRKAINFGFFDILATPLLMTMNIIHDVIPNYGVAIILLTILIKLIFWPLGTKSYKSMNEMKKVQPLMMEIREKYKDDKQRMNQEIMSLYKTYKVNPASGCLPLLVQMPIFFALYRMLYQAIELRHAPFVGWISDLSGPDRLFSFDFSIPMMDAPYGVPVLTLLMGASFLIQQKMTPTAGDPMQAKMMMLMPIFMTVLFINFPSGLVLYMFVNNIISMGQQFYTQKKFSK